jgi:hypothetical protein
MKSIKLIIATTCLLGIVLGNLTESAEARTRKRYSGRGQDEQNVDLSFSLIDETLSGQVIKDLASGKDKGLFIGVITDYQTYKEVINTGSAKAPFKFNEVEPTNIAKQVALADLEIELITNANITSKLSKPGDEWTVAPSFKGNIITYKFLNPQDSNKVLSTFYLVSDPIINPSNFNEALAINSFQDLFSNNWLDLTTTKFEAQDKVKFGNLFSSLSGPQLERSQSDNPVAVPEANLLNPLMLFVVLGMGFLLKRKSIN